MGKHIIVETQKDKKGKYGRYLADLWVEDENDKWVNMNDLMVQKGFAYK